MRDTQRRESDGLLMKTECQVQPIHIREHLCCAEKLTASHARTADSLLDQRHGLRRQGGGHPALAIFFHNLHRQALNHACQERTDDAEAVSLRKEIGPQPLAQLG